MDSANLILTETISLPTPLRNLNKADDIPEQKKEQVAKNFESILLGKLLDEMKGSIGDWGFEKSPASEQIQGIFWLYLSRHLADNGGLGMWKDIYKTLNNPDQTNKNEESEPKTQNTGIGNPDK
jgi:Rod binding domain-containing protein